MELVDLVWHAEALGLQIEWDDLGTRAGELHDNNLILINPNHSLMTQKVAIAHECGHHVLGHDWRQRHNKRKDEQLANLYAANLLINPAECTQVAELVDGDCRAIGRELGVPVALIRLWGEQHGLL